MAAPLFKDEDCSRGLALLTHNLRNGLLPRETATFFTACRLIGVPKSLDPLHANDPPRPIAMGELFLKAAGLHALEGGRATHAELLLPAQLAVGVPGGCEIACTLTRAALIRRLLGGPRN